MDGLAGRITDETTNFSIEPGLIDKRNAWSRGSSISIFFRTPSIQGLWFDENLGLGSGTRWLSGEETEYMLQLLNRGARLHYDPDLIVVHPSPVARYDPAARRRAYTYGYGMGYILKMHDYPLWFVVYQWTRPIGGMLLALRMKELAKARYHLAIFRGRLTGWLAG
jgi:GT2 family glycosyltransferase